MNNVFHFMTSSRTLAAALLAALPWAGTALAQAPYEPGLQYDTRGLLVFGVTLRGLNGDGLARRPAGNLPVPVRLRRMIPGNMPVPIRLRRKGTENVPEILRAAGPAAFNSAAHY